MIKIIHTTSQRRLPAKLLVGGTIAAILALGTFAGSADAREYHHYYNGGYYRSPPVVYGSRYGNRYYGSYYNAPPLIYGPRIGINLPGLSIGIR